MPLPEGVTQADLDRLRAALEPGPMPQSELTADVAAFPTTAGAIVPLLKAGYLAGRPLYDEAGAYLEALVYRPEDEALIDEYLAE